MQYVYHTLLFYYEKRTFHPFILVQGTTRDVSVRTLQCYPTGPRRLQHHSLVCQYSYERPGCIGTTTTPSFHCFYFSSLLLLLLLVLVLPSALATSLCSLLPCLTYSLSPIHSTLYTLGLSLQPRLHLHPHLHLKLQLQLQSRFQSRERLLHFTVTTQTSNIKHQTNYTIHWYCWGYCYCYCKFKG